MYACTLEFRATVQVRTGKAHCDCARIDPLSARTQRHCYRVCLGGVLVSKTSTASSRVHARQRLASEVWQACRWDRFASVCFLLLLDVVKGIKDEANEAIVTGADVIMLDNIEGRKLASVVRAFALNAG
ncbi:hypothetical protein BJV74DRAFT_96112 [Russula compacta]|nr:hypothetical protein BJV74DRAFT_96112 [Russula compacta]